MVDKYLPCPAMGCSGVAVVNETDLRRSKITYKCEKCGNIFTVDKKNLNFGKNTLYFGDPKDFMRSGVK